MFILLVARLQDDVSSAVPWRSVQSNAALLAVQPRGAAQVLRPATRPQCHQKEVMTSSRRPKQKSLLNYMDGADGGLNTCVSIQLKKKKNNTRQKHTLTDPQQNKEHKCREMSCSGQHWTSPPGTNQHLSINWLTLHKPESSEIRWWNLRLNLFLKRKTPNVYFFFFLIIMP